jgi:histidinol phosphatase-like PHP family hydrolase
MKRVIDALVRNDVALEINSRYRIPSLAFVRKAKQAGVKFTMGTNNGGRDLGRNEYGLQVVRDCGLTWRDMWMPRPDGQKPVQRKVK